VTSRPIRTGNAEVEFFFVVELALKLHPNRAQRHDDSAIARDFRGQVDWTAAWGFCRDQHTVGAMTAGMAKAQIAKLTFRCRHCQCAHLRRKPSPFLSQVKPNHATSGG